MSDIAAINSLNSGATSSTSSTGDLGGIADDFTTFLTLLTTQLQNQDPLDPTDTNEFTNQLVAFSQVEQQIRSNQQLEEISDQLSFNNLSAKAGFLGQLAQVEHDTGYNTGSGVSYQYQLNETPVSTNLRIVNETGNTVYQAAGELRQGLFRFDWDGLNQDGVPVPEGNYRLVVDTEDEFGGQVSSTIMVEDEIREIDGLTGDFLIADRTFEQSELLRLIAAGV